MSTARRYRLLKGGSILVVIGLAAYVGGVFSAAFETSPYRQLLKTPFTALEASRKQSETLSSVLNSNSWLPVRYDEKGVVTDRREKTYEGYTFYTGHDTRARLIDMNGNVVHEWNLPFREAWPESVHVSEPTPESFIYWRAELLSDGDVIAIYATPGDTPYGYGLVRIDRNSEVVWRFSDRMHHDFSVRSDGSVYALAHNFRNTEASPVSGVPQFRDVILKDDIVHISPEGEEIGRVSILELIADSPYRDMLQMFAPKSKNPASGHFEWDVLHTNALAEVGPDFAEHHAFAEPGQLMVSLRGFDAVALIDMEAEQLVWLSRGFWTEQHDPDPLPNGNILIFDNQGHGGTGGQSRVLEFNPSTNAVAWSYTGDDEYPLWSRRRSSQQPLSNGNVLITSTEEGRIFEVTREGEIVWNFIHPERRTGPDGQEFISMVNSGHRVRAEALTFLEEP